MGEDSELGERRGTGIKQPTKAQLDAERKKRGEHVSSPEGTSGGGEVGPGESENAG